MCVRDSLSWAAASAAVAWLTAHSYDWEGLKANYTPFAFFFSSSHRILFTNFLTTFYSLIYSFLLLNLTNISLLRYLRNIHRLESIIYQILTPPRLYSEKTKKRIKKMMKKKKTNRQI